jgi:peptidoglycan/LPS O-acetylase OafA/YrhL
MLAPLADIRSNSKSSHLGYRPDIDGLRAIAVLLVVFYHLRTAKDTGGFIGVDTFFVISGYLISSLILSDLGANKFSLVHFYERRIRRIFPALLVMLFGVAALAVALLLPTELEACAKSLLAALFSASNFYFWKHSGYFDATNSISPLLHTWSLAVEEQFYLVLPLLLRLLRPLSRRQLVGVIMAIAIASLVWSSIGAVRNDSAAFYMLHTRAWELLAGTLLALCPERIQLPHWLREGLAVAGVLFILWPAFTYNDGTAFPGLTAIPPCLGTALVIFSGFGQASRQSLVGRLLSLPPMRFIGLISYSLYLWHWPLIVFSRVSAGIDSELSPRLVKLGLLIASFALATVSWRFVEMPFRYGRFRPRRTSLFAIAAAAAASLALVGAALLLFAGTLTRWPKNAVQVGAYLDYKRVGQFREGSCFVDGGRGERFNAASCLAWNNARKNDLLIGDSHAAALWYGLSHTFTDVNFMQATATGCKPLPAGTMAGTFNSLRERFNRCEDLMSYVYRSYLPSQRPDALLIAARWAPDDLDGLRQAFEAAAKLGIPVVLFGPMVEYDAPLPRLLAQSIRLGDRSLPDRHLLVGNWALESQMSALAAHRPNVRYVSLLAPLCRGRNCACYSDDGAPLEFDTNHYTMEGSLLVAQRIKTSGGL